MLAVKSLPKRYSYNVAFINAIRGGGDTRLYLITDNNLQLYQDSLVKLKFL